MNKKSTKSLKEIYNKSFICETPLKLSDLYTQEDLENDEKNHTEAVKYINGTIGKLIDSVNYLVKIDIYVVKELSRDNESLMVYKLIDKDKQEIVGFIKLLKILDNKNKEYFSTYGLWKKKSFKGSLIFNFFTKWLLPKYKLIISDNGTTDLGEKFWLKIISYGLENNKECGIFKDADFIKLNEQQFTRLYKIEDFSVAWKKAASFQRIYIKE